jgi:hypothetical protein
MNITFHNLRERPDLASQILSISRASWPPFLFHSDVKEWDALVTRFAEYQFVLCEPADEVIAIGHCAPLPWDGSTEDLPETINGILRRAYDALEAGTRPTAVSALAAMVRPDRRGQGLSAEIVGTMRRITASLGLRHLIAPVRPAHKSAHPRIAMEVYASWVRPDGLPYDPWIRVHRRMGAEFRRVIPASLVVEGSVADWEGWTGMRFETTGLHDVAGALAPVSIDRERDRGRYEDPNFWMVHPVDGTHSGLRPHAEGAAR